MSFDQLVEPLVKDWQATDMNGLVLVEAAARYVARRYRHHAVDSIDDFTAALEREWARERAQREASE